MGCALLLTNNEMPIASNGKAESEVVFSGPRGAKILFQYKVTQDCYNNFLLEVGNRNRAWNAYNVWQIKYKNIYFNLRYGNTSALNTQDCIETQISAQGKVGGSINVGQDWALRTLKNVIKDIPANKYYRISTYAMGECFFKLKKTRPGGPNIHDERKHNFPPNNPQVHRGLFEVFNITRIS